MSAPWQVWSIDRVKRRAMVVDEGPKAYCMDSMRRRNSAAERLGLSPDSFWYQALAPDQTPDWDEA